MPRSAIVAAKPALERIEAGHGAAARDHGELGVEVQVARDRSGCRAPSSRGVRTSGRGRRAPASSVRSPEMPISTRPGRRMQTSPPSTLPSSTAPSRGDAEAAQGSGQMGGLAAAVRRGRAKLDEAPGGHQHAVAGEGEIGEARPGRDEMARDPRFLEPRRPARDAGLAGARRAGRQTPGEAVAGDGVARHHRKMRRRAQQDVGEAARLRIDAPAPRRSAARSVLRSRRSRRRPSRATSPELRAVPLEAAGAADRGGSARPRRSPSARRGSSSTSGRSASRFQASLCLTSSTAWRSK